MMCMSQPDPAVRCVGVPEGMETIAFWNLNPQLCEQRLELEGAKVDPHGLTHG
jgi:hypothetical protein